MLLSSKGRSSIMSTKVLCAVFLFSLCSNTAGRSQGVDARDVAVQKVVQEGVAGLSCAGGRPAWRSSEMFYTHIGEILPPRQ